MKFKTKGIIGGCASTAFLFSSIVNAGNVVVTGTYTGANGAPDTESYNQDYGFYTGDSGKNGYDATDSNSTYVFNQVKATGGNGGSLSYAGFAGSGGYGVYVNGPTLATFNSGSYTGGSGGSSSGVSGGGFPGAGSIGSVIINGGTFTGGAGIDNVLQGGDGYATLGGTLTILNGTFIGGTGVKYGGARALVVSQSTANIYGGSFSSPSGPNIYDYASTINIYGANFAIDGVPIGSGPILALSGTLTGLLKNNSSPSSISFSNSGGTINIVSPHSRADLTGLGRRRSGNNALPPSARTSMSLTSTRWTILKGTGISHL